MLRNIFFFFFFASLLLISNCSDPLDARFDQGEIPTETVWQLLTENAEYSGFVDLLQETGMDSVLNRNTAFTVFAIPNALFPDISGLSLQQKRQYASNHISNFVVFTADMHDGSSLKMLSGKKVFFSRAGSGFSVNDDALLVSTDHLATNGVLHQIDNLLEIRPNLLEFLQGNPEYSYVAEILADGTTLLFDEENSSPIGINEEGQTVYDSVWKQSNDFFDQIADISSEDETFTLFLVSNSFLDTFSSGSFKFGYLSNLGNFIINGLVEESEMPGSFTAVNGFSLNVNSGNYSLLQKLSNGYAYKLNGFEDIKIPKEFEWELTAVSDFDSIRFTTATEYAAVYDQMTEIIVTDLDGSFTNFKYDILPGPLNNDYLKIITSGGTTVKISFKLPDILPGKYLISLGAQIRVVDAIDFTVWINDEEIETTASLNGGIYNWDTREIGTAYITRETGNWVTFSVQGFNGGHTRGYLDYLKFEPTN